jgi:hypothetical protein
MYLTTMPKVETPAVTCDIVPPRCNRPASQLNRNMPPPRVSHSSSHLVYVFRDQLKCQQMYTHYRKT